MFSGYFEEFKAFLWDCEVLRNFLTISFSEALRLSSRALFNVFSSKNTVCMEAEISQYL